MQHFTMQLFRDSSFGVKKHFTMPLLLSVTHSLPPSLLLFSFTCVLTFHSLKYFATPPWFSNAPYYASTAFSRSLSACLLLFSFTCVPSFHFYFSDRRGHWRGFYFPATAHLRDSFFSRLLLLSKHCHPWVLSLGLIFFGDTD